MLFHNSILTGLVALAVSTGCSAVSPAWAASPEIVSALSGAWGGSGRISYTDGSSEGLSCTAYYTGAESELRMAIQCRSDKNPVNLRSRLKIDGRRASGDWEERTFNASGTATGTVDAARLTLNVTGGGFTGTMSVSFGKASHTVTISTQGIAMTRVSIQLSRK